MTITIDGHTVPVRDLRHARKLFAIAADLHGDALYQWLYAGAPEEADNVAETVDDDDRSYGPRR